jgi:hypothetical protein
MLDEACAERPMIEIASGGGDWGVAVDGEPIRSFSVLAQAVAFATRLADRLAPDGPQPRILVRLSEETHPSPRYA